MPPLVDELMLPTSEPTEPFRPDVDVVSWCDAKQNHLVFFVSKRTNGTFGAGVSAWVAWRDAGANVRDHGWYGLPSSPSVIASSVEEVASLLEVFAEQHGYQVGQWNTKT
jgi:hypothetical protein